MVILGLGLVTNMFKLEEFSLYKTEWNLLNQLTNELMHFL